MESEKPEILVCACSSREHIIIFQYDEEYNEIFCHVHLVNNRSFFKRFVIAVRYIFGYKCRYGSFEEIILDSTHSEKLIKMGSKLKEKK